MRNYNPYLLLYLIPLALVAAVIYYVIAIMPSLSILSATLIIASIAFSVLFMIRNIRKSNIADIAVIEDDPVEVVVRKIMSLKQVDLTEKEMDDLLKEAKTVYRSPITRDEKTSRLKTLVDQYAQKARPEKR